MICISIGETSIQKCLQELDGINFAEIRMDMINPSMDDVKAIFSTHNNLIATCRPGTLDEKTRKKILISSIEYGAAFVDIEVESNDEYKKDIINKAKYYGCKVIMSFHNEEKTPNKIELEHIITCCFKSGADIAKIACKVCSNKDNARLLGLLDSDYPLIVIGMGDRGKITRIFAPMLGSLFTFASIKHGGKTGNGQLDAYTIQKLTQELKNV